MQFVVIPWSYQKQTLNEEKTAVLSYGVMACGPCLQTLPKIFLRQNLVKTGDQPHHEFLISVCMAGANASVSRCLISRTAC